MDFTREQQIIRFIYEYGLIDTVQRSQLFKYLLHVKKPINEEEYVRNLDRLWLSESHFSRENIYCYSCDEYCNMEQHVSTWKHKLHSTCEHCSIFDSDSDSDSDSD